jgi:predicted peptidase
MIRKNCLLIIGGVIGLIVFSVSCSEKQTGQHAQFFRNKITKYTSSQYLLYLPKDYWENEKKWPLVFYLHGSGARGEDVNRVKNNGLPKLVEEGREFPFILVSPQHKKNTRWSNDFLEALLDEIISDYHVDEDRVYITGLSGGGRGTWYFATEYPDRFAAIAVISARGIPEGASRIKHIPIWIFHGAKDKLVPIRHAEAMVAALKAVGGSVKYTVYPEAGHNAWTETYDNPKLYEWLLSHERVRKGE